MLIGSSKDLCCNSIGTLYLNKLCPPEVGMLITKSFKLTKIQMILLKKRKQTAIVAAFLVFILKHKVMLCCQESGGAEGQRLGVTRQTVRKFFQYTSLLSLVSVSANTPQTFDNYPPLK